MTDEGAPLSAEAAARALAELPRYEEALTAKAFGITIMAFGIASAAIGMTYHISAPWLITRDLAWLLSLLWAPWIAAAAILVGTVWHAQSISLGSPDDREPRAVWWYAAGFSVLYLVLEGLANLVRAQTAWSAQDGVLSLYVLAVFTASIAAIFTWRLRAGSLAWPLFVAAFVILTAALGGDVVRFDAAGAVLYGAAVTLVGYMGAGMAIARRG